MAYVTSASYGGRYLKLECWENATDVVQNYSQVGATLSSIGGSVAYYSIYNWGGDVNGNRLWGISTTYWNSYAFPAATGSDTKYITVYHNADGSVGNVGFTLYGKATNFSPIMEKVDTLVPEALFPININLDCADRDMNIQLNKINKAQVKP